MAYYSNFEINVIHSKQKELHICHPQWGHMYKPTTGTKLVYITKAGPEWLDAAIRIMYDLWNAISTPKLQA